MRKQRRLVYRKHWNALVRSTFGECYYCGDIPSVIDHILPVSAGGSHEFDNLVPSCALCNLIAGAKVFDSLEDKRIYVIKRRNQKRKLRRAICTECLLPFGYRSHSPSLFLCAECYDLEYDTNKAQTKRWQDWLRLLDAAGFPIEIYRRVGDFVRQQGGLPIEDRYRVLWSYFEEAELEAVQIL